MNPRYSVTYEKMLGAIDRIATVANSFKWESEFHYACWLAQSFHYVKWTTRQLAMASAYTKPIEEDSLHWRFIEEAKEEKKHEMLALKDLECLGYSANQFPELPHTSFFYQTLTYLIQHQHPIAILGYSLTLEGFAAKRLNEVYSRIKFFYPKEAISFLRVHCELDLDHFENALPYLKSCDENSLLIIEKAIEQCCAIYIGILEDINHYASLNKSIPHPVLSAEIL